MNKIATIHQPHFLPWIGYLHKIFYSDVFIILDDVKYKKLYFQNRTYIKNMHGNKYRLSVPVKFNEHSTIKDVRIDGKSWQFSFLKTIEQSYSNSLFINDYWSEFESIIKQSNSFLYDLNIETLRFIFKILSLEDRKIFFSSKFQYRKEKTLRLIDLCHLAGINQCIFGEGASMEIHNVEIMRNEKIKIIKQDFKVYHPKYFQCRGSDFIPNLSIIDSIFNIGSIECIKMINEIPLNSNNNEK